MVGVKTADLLFYIYVLVGNKCDCPPERRVVVKEDAVKFAEQMGIQLFETSAKDNINIEAVGTVCCVSTLKLYLFIYFLSVASGVQCDYQVGVATEERERRENGRRKDDG